MSDSIRELRKTYEKSILKVNEKDIVNFEPNFKIQEELERRNREFLAKSTRKRRRNKMNFEKYLADKKAIRISPKSISKIYRLFRNLAWYEDYYECIDDMYRATISEQDIEKGYITLPYYIGSIFHFYEINEQDEFLKELAYPTTKSNILYLPSEIKAGTRIELCCYRDTQPDDDHWGQSNWVDFETAGAGWMWLGYKSNRETIKAIRRRARPYKADTYLYYDNGEPIICWWEDKRKCLTEVRLSNDEHIMF